MANKIPIDDLFRNGLSHGEEPMNMEAWANMARMLDGEDPYAKPEKRKRRFAPWIWGACIITALSGALLVWQNQHKASDNQKLAVNSKSSISAVNQTAESSSRNADSSNVYEAKQANPSSVSTENKNKLKAMNSRIAATPKRVNSKVSANSITEKQTSYNTDTENRNYQDHARNSVSINDENLYAHTESTPKDVASVTVQKKTIHNKNKSKQKIHSTPSSGSTENNDKEQALATTTIPEITSQESATKPEINRKTKQVTKVELTEQVQRNRSGLPIRNTFDTVSITRSEEEAVQRRSRDILPDPSGKYHPRYVVLSSTEEANAQKQQALAEAIPQNVKSSSVQTASSSSVISAKSTGSLKSDIVGKSEKQNNKSNETSLTRLRTKAAIFKDDFVAKTGKSCPGMSMGVHAAINNPQNNFGGFQFGLNNLKPFGDYFSLLTEVKFFLRNNSGYTIRDIMTTNRNVSIDNVSVQGHTVYSYQVDSNSNLYNFKHFASIELPLAMQFHYRRLTAYAGLNLAYQFRLQTTTVQRNYVVNHSDTLANGNPFSMPFEQGRDITRDDFKARLGLGMIGGLSYSFNPQLYVDLRVVQNLSDNARTLSARAVSENTFRVPSIQLSLGYRFRKFVPAQ